MCKCSWQRARNDEQIGQRVNAILDAAGRVFHNVPYEHVTMLMIAREAKFTRSNLYRYFKTREEIFLALFMADIDTWAQHVTVAFTRPETPESFAAKWTAILCRQKRLLELAPLLALSLEKNLSPEIYRRTKLALHERIGAVIPVLQQALPALDAFQCHDFILFHQALLAGAWPMTQYNAMQLQTLEQYGMQDFKIDFASFYKKGIFMYLRGLEQEQEQ
ncbi:MAG TPA: TetR family transcriptional regulator [bacterium]|nr:TetR family transcriptional regulator [bacterium]HPN45742.1 TetR family transcriptional regulator [bacterium]